ncbi:MAG: chloride channel protein, partial [Candidatus Bathyarchaeia archaeon]
MDSDKEIIAYSRLMGMSAFIGLAVSLGVVVFVKLHSIISDVASMITLKFEYSIIFIPVLGLALSYLIVHYLAETRNTGCGTHELLEVYHFESGLIPERDTIVKPIASALTIGLKGSAGLEGPSLLLGGGIASFIWKKLSLKSEELREYLLAGAAAGLSAVFKAPLTGVLFALEIPYQQDLAKEALIPATIASIVAYFTSINFLGVERIFPSISGIIIPSYSMLLHSIVLGVMAAALGILFVIVNEVLKRLNGKSGFNMFSTIILGGLLIGLIGFICPQVLGLGYGAIEDLINGKFFDASLLFLLSIILLKIFATSITLNMGGSGGLFVPSIYVGATLGALYSKCVLNTPNEIIVMAAMAALIASTNKTMLASIAFVAETTGPSSIITTMIAASIAYLISGRFSFFKDVQPQRRLVEEEKAINILYHTVMKKGSLDSLKSIKVSQIMTKDPVVLQERMSIG